MITSSRHPASLHSVHHPASLRASPHHPPIILVHQVIRAISVLEGIALVGNPNFAIIDEAYPYISRRLMTDDRYRHRPCPRAP